jgi:hypothetical protein
MNLNDIMILITISVSLFYLNRFLQIEITYICSNVYFLLLMRASLLNLD